MTTNKHAADQLEAAAEALDGSEKPIMSGVVLASGLSRLLERLAAPGHEAKNVPHDMDVDDEGYPKKVEPDPSRKAIRIEKCKPFAVISAFRSTNALPVNLKRSAKLLTYINNLMGKPGAYKLIGHWAEKKPEAGDMPYKEAKEKGLIGEPTKEDSYLIVKPESMTQEVFEGNMRQLGQWFKQDGVLVADGNEVSIMEPASGSKFKIGTEFTAPLIAKAYSVMRKMPNLPFVFAGTQQPTGSMGAMLFAAAGLRYLPDTRAVGQYYLDFMGAK